MSSFDRNPTIQAMNELERFIQPMFDWTSNPLGTVNISRAVDKGVVVVK